VNGLDTDLFLSHLTLDEPVPSRGANAEPEKATMVLAVERILATAQFDVEQKDLVRRALEDYRKGKGDFSDYLIGHHNRDAGCVETVTFDRRLKKSSLFRVLSA
jgi:predicted nucleic-acid-binding protein